MSDAESSYELPLIPRPVPLVLSEACGEKKVIRGDRLEAVSLQVTVLIALRVKIKKVDMHIPSVRN